jgi:hypothetical protein
MGFREVSVVEIRPAARPPRLLKKPSAQIWSAACHQGPSAARKATGMTSRTWPSAIPHAAASRCCR